MHSPTTTTSAAMPSQSSPPARLQTREQFQAVMAEGMCARTSHFALHRLVLDAQAAPPRAFVRGWASGSAWWVGSLVPKRWARRSVTRHGVRRQIYAAAAECGAVLCPQEPTSQRIAYVVRQRCTFDVRQFPSAWSPALARAVRAQLRTLFARAGAA